MDVWAYDKVDEILEQAGGERMSGAVAGYMVTRKPIDGGLTREEVIDLMIIIIVIFIIFLIVYFGGV